MNGRARQRGMALMTALVLMALATVMAVAIGSSTATAQRRSRMMFDVDQALLIAKGAEALAAYVLRQDRSSQDTTIEAWNEHYGPVEIEDGVVLEAQLEDASGKFNLNSLVDNQGDTDPVAVEQFKYLLQVLKQTKQGFDIPDYYADRLADWLDKDFSSPNEDSTYVAQTPPYLAANLPITSTSELLQLVGFTRKYFDDLRPYVTTIPGGEKLNLCTAPPEVLDAFYSQAKGSLEVSYTGSSALTSGRKNGCFPVSANFTTGLDAPQAQKLLARIGESTNYFRLQTFVAVGTTRFALYSLIWRTQQGVRPILRSYAPD